MVMFPECASLLPGYACCQQQGLAIVGHVRIFPRNGPRPAASLGLPSALRTFRATLAEYRSLQ